MHLLSNELDEVRAIGKALADTGRLRILAALKARGELCVCHLVELLGLDQSTVSRHMAVLRDARLVAVRRDGRWAHYRIADEGRAPDGAGAVLQAVDAMLRDLPQIEDDARRLASICPPAGRGEGDGPCAE